MPKLLILIYKLHQTKDLIQETQLIHELLLLDLELMSHPEIFQFQDVNKKNN
jgi:hypothetical protein